MRRGAGWLFMPSSCWRAPTANTRGALESGEAQYEDPRRSRYARTHEAEHSHVLVQGVIAYGGELRRNAIKEDALVRKVHAKLGALDGHVSTAKNTTGEPSLQSHARCGARVWNRILDASSRRPRCLAGHPRAFSPHVARASLAKKDLSCDRPHYPNTRQVHTGRALRWLSTFEGGVEAEGQLRGARGGAPAVVRGENVTASGLAVGLVERLLRMVLVLLLVPIFAPGEAGPTAAAVRRPVGREAQGRDLVKGQRGQGRRK